MMKRAQAQEVSASSFKCNIIRNNIYYVQGPLYLRDFSGGIKEVIIYTDCTKYIKIIIYNIKVKTFLRFSISLSV